MFSSLFLPKLRSTIEEASWFHSGVLDACVCVSVFYQYVWRLCFLLTCQLFLLLSQPRPGEGQTKSFPSWLHIHICVCVHMRSYVQSYTNVHFCVCIELQVGVVVGDCTNRLCTKVALNHFGFLLKHNFSSIVQFSPYPRYLSQARHSGRYIAYMHRIIATHTHTHIRTFPSSILGTHELTYRGEIDECAVLLLFSQIYALVYAMHWLGISNGTLLSHSLSKRSLENSITILNANWVTFPSTPSTEQSKIEECVWACGRVGVFVRI